MPSLGSLGGDTASSLAGAKFNVDLLAVVSKPGQVRRQWPLWRIWVLWLTLSLGLDLAIITLLLELRDRRKCGTNESCEIELAKVEVLATSEDGIGMTDVGPRGIPECAFERNP